MKRAAYIIIATVAALGMAAPTGLWAQAVLVDGSVQKIDQAQGKVTLKHGPIRNLDMDAMTMVFRVKDAEMLKSLKVGQKVRFEADRVNGRITVTRIEGVR